MRNAYEAIGHLALASESLQVRTKSAHRKLLDELRVRLTEPATGRVNWSKLAQADNTGKGLRAAIRSRLKQEMFGSSCSLKEYRDYVHMLREVCHMARTGHLNTQLAVRLAYIARMEIFDERDAAHHMLNVMQILGMEPVSHYQQEERTLTDWIANKSSSYHRIMRSTTLPLAIAV